MAELVLRPAAVADAPDIARVRIDSWRATYRGLIPDAYLDGMQVDASVALWERVLAAAAPTASVFVVAHGDKVVGFAAGNRLAEPRLGLDSELSAVYLRPDFQRAGLGHRLVGAVVDAQRAAGATGIIVWTIAGNKPARAFYTQLGGRLLVEQPFQWDGMDLVEAGYGWDDLSALASACRMASAPQLAIMH
ncbi:MAG: GNAT family N-acetyltransferase [Casimicrobiaceae bacterium]